MSVCTARERVKLSPFDGRSKRERCWQSKQNYTVGMRFWLLSHCYTGHRKKVEGKLLTYLALGSSSFTALLPSFSINADWCDAACVSEFDGVFSDRIARTD